VVRFGITESVRPDGLDLVVVGEMDMDTAPELRTRLLAAVGAHDVVTLDLSGVTFIDSQGLSVLIRAHAEARATGSELRLGRASPRVRQLLELTNLTSLFLLEPDRHGR
jgi:anti-sigma B factor antagonist